MTQNPVIGSCDLDLRLSSDMGPVRNAGTYGGYPLHHAAKRGLDKTVLLLLSRGGTLLVLLLFNNCYKKMAHVRKHHLTFLTQRLYCDAADPLALNDDSLTPLDMARTRGHVSVVRMIEVEFLAQL